MTEQEVLDLWKKGIDKNKLAEIYKRNYNQHIKLIRSSVQHRHDGRFLTNRKALYIVERIIYKAVKEQSKLRNKFSNCGMELKKDKVIRKH